MENDPMTSAPMTGQLAPVESLTPGRLRAWSWHRQGLDGALAGCTAEQVFARAGWARSVGGANPYLTLFARAGIRREQVDADVLAHRILELPVARGCTYVLGREDFAWALQLGRDAAESAFKVVGRLGVDRGEITLLEEQVLHTLAEAEGPMDPRQLKDELGDSVRNLGEEGKKKGATTTLPTALGILQSDGRIRRVPANGRLDQQRYAYEPWDLVPSALSDEEVRTELIRRYLGWTGGAPSSSRSGSPALRSRRARPRSPPSAPSKSPRPPAGTRSGCCPTTSPVSPPSKSLPKNKSSCSPEPIRWCCCAGTRRNCW